MKISKIKINGSQPYKIDDSNAVQVPGYEGNPGESANEGDILVYRILNGLGMFVPEPGILDVDTSLNAQSNKPIANSAVALAIAAIRELIDNREPVGEVITVNYTYDPLTHKLIATILGNKEPDTGLDILVISLNSIYDETDETLLLNNKVGIISIDSNSSSGELQIEDFSDNRVFYFIILNQVTNGQIRINGNNSVIVPGIGRNQSLDISASVSYMDTAAIITYNITKNGAVTTDLDVPITLALQLTDTQGGTRTITTTLNPGDSGKVVNIGGIAYDSTGIFSITEMGGNSAYTIDIIKQGGVTQNQVSINSTLPTKRVYIRPIREGQYIKFNALVVDANDIPTDIDSENGVVFEIDCPSSSSQAPVSYLSLPRGYQSSTAEDLTPVPGSPIIDVNVFNQRQRWNITLYAGKYNGVETYVLMTPYTGYSYIPEGGNN